MKELVRRVVSQVMNTPAENITEESSPESIETWDSLQHMHLVLALEEELDVEFTDTEILELMSVKSILTVLKRKKRCNSG